MSGRFVRPVQSDTKRRSNEFIVVFTYGIIVLSCFNCFDHFGHFADGFVVESDVIRRTKHEVLEYNNAKSKNILEI